MLESGTGIVRWINENAFDASCKLLLQRLQPQQVVTKDQSIVEDVILSNAMRRMIRKRRVFEQNPRLQPRPVLLSNPSQFKLVFAPCH